MSNLIRLFFALSMLFSISPCFAKTGYIELMEAFESTSQGKKVKARLEKEAKAAEISLKKQEAKLKKEEASLQKEVAIISEQAKTQKIMQFQGKVANFQKSAKDKEVELQSLQNQLMEPILNRLKQVAGNVAQNEKYTVVKARGQDVLWLSPELDLTNKVVKAYNKKYKK